MKRVLLLLSIAAVLIMVGTTPVHAQSFCFGNCAAPPQVSTCANGGNPPNPSQSSYVLKATTAGSKQLKFIPSISGCNLYIQNLSGSVVATNPVSSGVEAGSFGVWTSTSTTCATLTAVQFNFQVGVNLYHPVENIVPQGGTTVNTNLNAPWGYCIGFDTAASDWYEAVNFVFGYQ